MFKRTVLALLLICTLLSPITSVARAVAAVSPDIWSEYVYWTNMSKVYPNGPYTLFNLSMTMAYMGKVEEGSKLLNRVAELDPDIVEKMLKRYNTVLAQDPNNWRTHFRLGFIYYFDNKLYKALEHLQWVADSEPVNGKNAWAYGYIAVIKAEQGKWNRAEEACKKALEIEPDGAALHAALAQAYYNQKKFVEASAEMIKALSLKKDFEEYEKKMWKNTK